MVFFKSTKTDFTMLKIYLYNLHFSLKMQKNLNKNYFFFSRGTIVPIFLTKKCTEKSWPHECAPILKFGAVFEICTYVQSQKIVSVIRSCFCKNFKRVGTLVEPTFFGTSFCHGKILPDLKKRVFQKSTKTCFAM